MDGPPWPCQPNRYAITCGGYDGCPSRPAAMRMIQVPRVLLVLALLLGQLAAVMHLAHDLDADGHDTASCEHCVQAATVLGGALPAVSVALTPPMPSRRVHGGDLAHPPSTAVDGCLIRGPPERFA